MRYAQLVIGPAGSGKSTYCSTMQKHGETIRRTINVVNLDPAAESYEYKPVADIRDLIHVDDAMEDDEMKFGPNGGLVFCMEFLLENLTWLDEQLGEIEDDYVIFDCPGQIELYTHLNVMKRLVEALQLWNFRVCAVYLVDSHFITNSASFISGALAALSAMVSLEVSHVNILSKVDLLSNSAKRQLERYLEPDADDLCSEESPEINSKWKERHKMLTRAIGRVLEDYSLVRFCPLNIKDEESIQDILFTVDNCLQFGENEEVRVRDFDTPEDDDGFNEPDRFTSMWNGRDDQ